MKEETKRIGKVVIFDEDGGVITESEKCFVATFKGEGEDEVMGVTVCNLTPVDMAYVGIALTEKLDSELAILGFEEELEEESKEESTN